MPQRRRSRSQPAGQSNPNLSLDPLDIGILSQIQRDALIPAARIGAAIGLSAAAVQRRIKRLRHSGTIRAICAQLEPSHLALPITCLVTVDLDVERSDQIDRFSRQAQAHPQVQQCYYVTGPTDFVLVVLARDMADYEQFTREMFLSNENVRSFTTHVCLQRLKTSLELPLGDFSRNE